MGNTTQGSTAEESAFSKNSATTERPCTNLAGARHLLRDFKNSTEHRHRSKFNQTIGGILDEYEPVVAL